MTAQPHNDAPLADQSVPLVVDLDGTLSRTDTLHEALLALAVSNPLQLLRVPGWMAEGRAELKAHLADRAIVDPNTLPMNDTVLEMVRTARSEGRPTALVSAADHRQVTAVAEMTGLFDEAFGSAEGRNLKGPEKAAFLAQHFGIGQYDYIGDSMADLPIWAEARHAITVNAGQKLRRAVDGLGVRVSHLAPPEGLGKDLLKAMRPHQWLKNMLLFLPMLAAHDFSAIVPLVLGFMAFCLSASAVYVINDLLDLQADRAHPRKCARPFASGALSAATGVVQALCLFLAALFLGLVVGEPLFLAVLAFYVVATFAYSLWLKRKLIIDVLMLAGLYTVRIIAGGAAASLELSPWMLGFSMFLFLALAAVKRQAELTDQMLTSRESSGRAYQVDDLPILRSTAISASHAAVLVLALYISSSDVQTLYSTPGVLWVICPLFLYWISRMVMKAHRGQMTDDPIIFAVTDRVSVMLVAAAIAAAVMAAVLGGQG